MRRSPSTMMAAMWARSRRMLAERPEPAFGLNVLDKPGGMSWA
jgi:hypothetical protein